MLEDNVLERNDLAPEDLEGPLDKGCALLRLFPDKIHRRLLHRLVPGIDG